MPGRGAVRDRGDHSPKAFFRVAVGKPALNAPEVGGLAGRLVKGRGVRTSSPGGLSVRRVT